MTRQLLRPILETLPFYQKTAGIYATITYPYLLSIPATLHAMEEEPLVTAVLQLKRKRELRRSVASPAQLAYGCKMPEAFKSADALRLQIGAEPAEYYRALAQYLTPAKLNAFVESQDELYFFFSFSKSKAFESNDAVQRLKLCVAATYLDDSTVELLLCKDHYSQADIDQAIASLIDITRGLAAQWEDLVAEQNTYNRILGMLFSYKHNFNWGILQRKNAVDEMAYLQSEYPEAGMPTRLGYYTYVARPYSYHATVATLMIAGAIIYYLLVSSADDVCNDDDGSDNTTDETISHTLHKKTETK